MPITVVIYGKPSDGAAYAALGQLRSIVMEMRLDASVQIVTDELQVKASAVELLPSITVDGVMISTGWVPSRSELRNALQQRRQQIDASRRTEE
jgi:hypothetical protein